MVYNTIRFNGYIFGYSMIKYTRAEQFKIPFELFDMPASIHTD